MAKGKFESKLIASNRTFLNPNDKYCMACIMWCVEVYYNRTTNDAAIDACLSVSDEAKHMMVSRIAHLKPIRTMQRELDTFDQAVRAAHRWIKEEGFKNNESDI